MLKVLASNLKEREKNKVKTADNHYILLQLKIKVNRNIPTK
jgi:hypothetical protein